MASPLRLATSIVLCAGLAAACAEEPPVFEGHPEGTVGEEVFRVFCKRTAAKSFPMDMEGMSFNAACEGRGMAPASEARFDALVARRTRVVDALDRLLGSDKFMAQKVVQVLEQDELKNFLLELIPLYEAPELLPQSSRSLADVMKRLIDKDDATGQKALTALSQITGRSGYRKLDLALGMIRTVLSYPELDALTESGLDLIAHGGAADKELDELLNGLTLELANYDPTPPAADSTLLLAKDLFLSPLEHVEQPGPEIFVTRRDARGVAVPNGGVAAPFVDGDGDELPDVDSSGRFLSSQGGAGSIPAPYKVLGENKSTPRDPLGRAVSGEKLLYADFDANDTMLAAFLREDARLSSVNAGDKTTFEKLGRALPTFFGTKSQRSVTYGKAKINFEGPDPATGPMYDLVHALGAMAKHPDEMRRLLVAFETTFEKNEPEIAALLGAMLNINERGKMHPDAVLGGPGGPGTPHRFWDDLLAVGVRISKRKGMLEAVLRSFVSEDANATTALMAKFMKYKDQVSYNGAPMTLSGGKYSEADATEMNTPIEHTLSKAVDRSMPGLDKGMNRSLFQRLISTIHATNGVPNCNKEGALLYANDPLTGTPLVFPDPINQPGANLVVAGIATTACAAPSGVTGSYKECTFVKQPNGAEAHMRSMIARGTVVIKDSQLLCLEDAGLANDLGETQEMSSQIDGFTLSLTPTSIARFIHAPRNDFLTGLFDPFPTKHGVPLAEFEPDLLFALELKQPDIKLKGEAQSFLTASKPLALAFDDNELFKETEDGEVSSDGYMFAELLSTLHMHWASRRETTCPAKVVKGDEGCTQSLDPKKPFFSHQTNLVSYEPLLIESLVDEKLGEILQRAGAKLAGVTVDKKDGITILAEFVEVMLKADPELTYRDGRTSALTNVGDEVGYVSPFYLLLDGLKAVDTAFASPEHEAEDRKNSWLEARSEIVDLFLPVEEVDGKQQLKDRLGRAIAIKTMAFLRGRIEAHVKAGDVTEWAAGLAPRAVTFFDTPLIAGLMRFLDKSWGTPAAGKELMKLIVYLVDEKKNPAGFEATVVAAADLFQLLEDSKSIAPVLDLAADAVSPGVTKAVDTSGGTDFSPETGVVRRVIELQKTLLELHMRRPSTISRVLRNAVSDVGNGTTPLEAMIDAISEVERTDPSKPATATLEKKDLEAIALSVHTFLMDPDHGIERLYAVIQNRKLTPNTAQEQEQKP